MSVTTTPNYGLKMPDGSEKIKPGDFNYNAQIIDTELKKREVLTGTAAPTTATVGVKGQFYFDSTNVVFYKCALVSGSVYTWKPLILRDWTSIQTFATAGSFVWTAPDLYGNGLPYDIWVLIDGAGGSGAAGVVISSDNNNLYGSGGGSGVRKRAKFTVTPGLTYNVVVGAGGAAYNISLSSSYSVGSNNGGASSFSGISAAGGYGGSGGLSGFMTNDDAIGSVQGKGGQSAFGAYYLYSYYNILPQVPRGGMPALRAIYVPSTQPYSRPAETLCSPYELENPFDPGEIGFASGAGGVITQFVSSYLQALPTDLSLGVVGAPAVGGYQDSIGHTLTAGATTAPSSGGSVALIHHKSGYQCTVTSGKGGDGRVRIYARAVD